MQGAVQPQPLFTSPADTITSLPSGDDPGLIVELRPRGYLRCFVYSHQVAGHPCWSFISNGLVELRQKEVVMTILQERNAPHPQSPLDWFEVLYSVVQSGKVINDMDLVTFSRFQFLGRSDIAGFVHSNPVPLGNLPSKLLPEKYLQATAVTKPEADVILRYGALRFFSHLGHSVRSFPYPPWIDPQRKTVISLNDFSQSLVNSCAFLDVRVQAVRIGDDVHAYMSAKTTLMLTPSLAQLDLKSAFALPCGLLEAADSCYVWKNGQVEPTAIGTGLKRTNLCFLGFCPLPEAEFTLRLCEDGCFMILSHKDLARVRESISTRQPITLLDNKTGQSFHLNMKQDMYHDHSKDRVYVVPCTDAMTSV